MPLRRSARRSAAALAAPLLLLVASGNAARAQFPRIKVPKVHVPGVQAPSLPGLDGLMSSDPITSAFEDAVSAITFLDDYTPVEPIPMQVTRRDADGTFHLAPGTAYQFDAQSYCLHAGTYGPGHGEGYLLAPLKGPRAALIRDMLVRSYAHPEVAENDVQVTIWAILARTKFTEMPPEMQRTAAVLLTPAELAELNGVALDALTGDAQEKLLSNVTGPLRAVLESENQLRTLLTEKEQAPYEQLEKVAVLSGDPAEHGPNVPRGRWSYHPGVGFVRFFPSGYRETQEQVVTPGRHTVARDAQGRIARVADGAGGAVVLTYADGGTGGAAGFASVRLEQDGAVPPGSVRERESRPAPAPDKVWEHTGWTFVGPMDKASGGALLPGATDRLRRERAAWDNATGLLRKLAGDSALDGPDGQTLCDLTHLRAALTDLTAADPKAAPWLRRTTNIVSEAWMETFDRIASRRRMARLSATSLFGTADSRFLIALAAVGDGGSGSGGGGFNPAGGVAMPADRGRQRLAQSGRPYGPPFQPIGDSPDGAAIQNALAQHGVPAQDVSAYQDADGGWHYSVRLGHGDNHPLPTQQDVMNSGTSNNEGAQQLLLVSVQQTDSQTRVTVRTDDVETGVVTAAGKGTSDGTDGNAVTSAANQAIDNSGISFGGGKK